MAEQLEENEQVNIEAESSSNENGDAASDDGASVSGSSTASVSSSLFLFREEHGRTYGAQANEKYPFPIDAAELDRLDLQHYMFRLVHDGKLCLAPLEPNPGRVLDIGTGTGLWAIEFADENPSSSVLGIDTAPIQPPWVPVNLRFEVCDASEDWTFDRKFDYIHARYLYSAISEKKLFRQVYENLKPGGWFEIKETSLPLQCDDGTLEGTALKQWCDDMERLGRSIGVDFLSASHYKEWLEEAGFINVQAMTFPLPISRWPKDPKLKVIGDLQRMIFADGVDGFSKKLFVEILGYTEEQLQVMLMQVCKDISNTKIHAYLKNHTVIGQKHLR